MEIESVDLKQHLKGKDVSASESDDFNDDNNEDFWKYFNMNYC